MIDAVVLILALASMAAGGLAVLEVIDALPHDERERLLVGTAAGFALAGIMGLVLAAAGALRPLPIAAAGVLALVAGAGALRRSLRAARRPAGLGAWAVVGLCAILLAAEVATMVAPPVGGDQTKYQLVYPRLYGMAGRLVATPWTFWGHMQYLENFVFAIGYALRGDVLARFFNGATGVLAALALARLARRHLGRETGLAAGALFFTLPITWSLMTRAGSDLAVVFFGALAAEALLDWGVSRASSDLRRAAVMAGFAGGSKVMGLLLPALVGVGVLAVLARGGRPWRARLEEAVVFGVLVLLAASPCYVRNAVETGNPIYPFGYGVFGGRNWSAAASQYLADYYRQYQDTWAERRQGGAYAGLAVLRFPWDLTMHPGSFEKAARQALDISPFLLAFAPALALVERRRGAALAIGGIGLAYVAIIAGGAWAHPRYVLPGLALLLVACVAAAACVVGRRGFALLVALTVAGNLAVTSRLLSPLWPDQARVALGRLGPTEFLRRHSERFAFWERANAAVPRDGRVLVLEKIPHPYYIDRPFVLGSYLEQGLIDYRQLDSPAAVAGAARLLGITHVALDVEGLDAAGDPFEAQVMRLWRALVSEECDPVLRAGGFGLYRIRTPTGVAAITEGTRG
ncbi:MAG: glycosyltransferase family 39 protein [Candidatus Binatia bacterium]